MNHHVIKHFIKYKHTHKHARTAHPFNTKQGHPSLYIQVSTGLVQSAPVTFSHHKQARANKIKKVTPQKFLMQCQKSREESVHRKQHSVVDITANPGHKYCTCNELYGK